MTDIGNDTPSGQGTATLERPLSTEPAPSPPKRPRNSTRQVIIFAVALALVAGASLILLMTITGGDQVDAANADTTVLSQRDVTDALLRDGQGPDTIDLEVLYTPQWYFSWSSRPEPATDGSPTLAFLVFETIHAGELPATLPRISVVTPSGTYEPTAVMPVTEAPHHRVSQLLFPAETAGGDVVIGEEETMTVSARWADTTEATMQWEQPLPFGLSALNTAESTTTFTRPALSLGSIAAIFSGMLAALAPCLLLLAAYYTAVLSGTAAATVEGSAPVDRRVAERRLLTTGLFFVGGFTAVYTAGGVVAGYIGESIGRFDDIGGYARPVSIVAGIVVILLGIRTASQAKVPVVCKIPGFNRPTQTGWLGSAVMGSSFAVGCLSCFSATVLTALLLYAGATGSPLTGGLVMLMFSAGVGVMFLLAAVLVAKAVPVATWLAKAQPVIGVVSATIMIFLGILMVTYKFHIVTGYLFDMWS